MHDMHSKQVIHVQPQDSSGVPAAPASPAGPSPVQKSSRSRSGAMSVAIEAGVVALLLAALLVISSGRSHAQPASRPVAASQHTLRIGLYDSRAIAVAYIRSPMAAAEMQTLLRERADAQKAGDKKRVKELNALGESLQVRHHLQGFSTAPVDEILATVRDALPAVAQEAGVIVIARAADWHAADVETIDVTDALVRLFEPDAQTLKMIQELRAQPPMPIEAAAKLPANH